MATCSRLNRSRIPSKLLFMSGPVSNMSFKDMSWWGALESNTTRVWSSLHSLHMPKLGRYQHSLPSCRGGASSAWSWSKIFCMEDRKWVFISGFLSRVRQRLVKPVRACSLLFGRRGLDVRKGRGTTQLLASFMNISLLIIWMNCLSWIDGVTLLLPSVLSNILLPSEAFWSRLSDN